MDLLSPRPFWPIRDGLPATFPPLERATECDVAIIGAGITGAIVAWFLATAGLDVVVLDRREAAHGSTAGNTGLVLFELDEMLHHLARHAGCDAAARAYRRCERAVGTLDQLLRSTCTECGYERRASVQLAAVKAHVPRLRREFEARREAGLNVEWWPRSRIARESTLPNHAAIQSHGAQIDPYRFAYGMLMAARKAGARIHDRTRVTRRRHDHASIDLQTSRQHRVRARHLVVANGYEADESIVRRIGTLYSTYALVTEPLAAPVFHDWPANRALLWDTANPYIYLRTTSDNRAIIGGYDEPFRNARARDQRVAMKSGVLQRRLRRMFPQWKFEVATAWAGTFGSSHDGLPVIGRHPSRPQTWYALGFGGNGITFSVIAGEIIRTGILGEVDPDATLFGFERLESAVR